MNTCTDVENVVFLFSLLKKRVVDCNINNKRNKISTSFLVDIFIDRI